jgi:hypothetical protein
MKDLEALAIFKLVDTGGTYRRPITHSDTQRRGYEEPEHRHEQGDGHMGVSASEDKPERAPAENTTS